MNRLIRTFSGSFTIKPTEEKNVCKAYSVDGDYLCTINCSFYASDETIANAIFNELLGDEEDDFEDIIKESVRSVLYEMDIVPTNKHGETNLVKKQSINAWRMIYRLMDNIKVVMDNQYKSKNGNITNKDVDGIIDYLYNSLQNVTKNTIGEK